MKFSPLPILIGCQMYCVCPLLLCGRIWLKALAEGPMALISDRSVSVPMQWRWEGGEGQPPREAFEGRKFGILAFALQCVSVSLYLFLIYSEHCSPGAPEGLVV